jgi:outer membrane protein TolC
MIPILVCLLLNRCTSIHPELSSIKHPSHWGQTCKTGRMDYQNFWLYFNNPNIDRLVGFALAQNPDLIKAKHRILEARALYNSALVNVILPESTMRLQTMQGQNPMLFRQAGDTSLTQQQFELSWELDILGKKTKMAQVGSAILRKTALKYKAIERLLIVDVITAYVDIQLQEQLLLSQRKKR